MGWESKVANQMLSCFCLFRNSHSWMAPLALLLLYSSYQQFGFGFLSLLFSSLAVLWCTVLYTWKHKAVPADKETVLGSEKSSYERKNIAPIPMCKNETKEREEEEVSDNSAGNVSAPSPDKLSTSEESDIDGSISDEDSLIEIALPNGYYVGQQKEESKYNCSLKQNKRELSNESLFKLQSPMEFLAEVYEMNEEENLIEIDISMGSIKYSRVEIEA